MEPISPAGIVLPAELGIEHTMMLHKLLAPHVATREPVVLLAHEVWRVHTATLQVLAAFFRARAAAGCLTTWHNPPRLLRENAARLGLDGPLGLAANSLI